MQNFGDSSVEFRVLFWVDSINFWIDVRAEIMTAIFQSFAEHKIEIPFTKRDLYLKSLPSSWQEKVERPSEITSSNLTNQTMKRMKIKNPLRFKSQRIN